MPPVQLSAVARVRSRSQALASRRRVASSIWSGSTGERVSASFKRLALPGSAKGNRPPVRMFHRLNQEGFMATEKKPQDGLQLLASDHRNVEDLFARFEKASGTSTKEKLVKE